MKKFLALFLVIYFGIIFFMPKEELLYTALNIASKQKIQISIKEQKDLGFLQTLEELELSYDGSRYAVATNATVVPLLFFNKISFTSVQASESFRAILPFMADSISLSYHLLAPMEVGISGDGDFGELNGAINLDTNRVKIILTPSKEFEKSNFIREFKKTKEGYIYESTIR